MSAFDLVLALIFALLLAVALVLFLPAPRSQAQPGPPADRDSTGPGLREDDRYWLGGLIYYNPTDPDPFLPKRYGLGWTVNFGRPVGKLFLVVLISLVLLPVVLVILVPGLPSSGCHPSGCHLLP